MGASFPQVQPGQGNQPVNPQPTQANYSPAQQQMSGKGSFTGFPAHDQSSDNIQNDVQTNSQTQQDYNPGGKGQTKMYSPLSNQPSYGQPNPYPNTIGQWDNASIQPQHSGKGKGG